MHANHQNSSSDIDDLFDDRGRDDKPATTFNYQCPACNKVSTAAEPLKYCGACGSPLHAGTGKAASSHVLVVEDAAVSRRKICAILRSLGCRVSAVEEGFAALRLVKEDLPDLIVLDVHMPNKSGIEVLTEIRQQHDAASLPIVMLTAEADIDIVRQAVRAGAQDYIRKDADTSEVRQRLNQHLQKLRARKA